MISLDTETTGVDFHHGAKPFLVTTCDEQGDQRFWEWDVDPLTRQPDVQASDVEEIRELIAEADLLVLQNPKFDVTALATIGIDNFPWHKVRDTLMAGHLLSTNTPHNLTDLAIHYLGHNIEQYEVDVKKVVTACRQLVANRNKKDGSPFEGWRLASSDLSDMPSIKGGSKRDEDKPWKNDMWLPRALIRHYDAVGEPWDDDPAMLKWQTVTSEYANTDSAVTLPLWRVMEREIKRRNLWKIYLERLKVVPIAFRMEHSGVTMSRARLEEMEEEFSAESVRCGRLCVSIAKGMNHDLVLPKSGNNKSLTSFVFDKLKLPVMGRSKKTGEPSLNTEAMDKYEAVLDDNSKPLVFISKLRDKRKRDTALSYMAGYKRFWVPHTGLNGHSRDWFMLHPNLNPTGTNTLRFSSYNPNSQNLSRQKGFNLRYCFGPAPGREWWVLDGKNLELRLPVYEAGEEAMIALFERPDDPPYFGSNHLLVAHILHPEKFEECLRDGVSFKDRYASTWYRRVKMGNFAITCGAVEESGTADKAYGVPGAQRRIKDSMKAMAELSKRLLSFATKHGYVETMPDKTVDPDRGFPIMSTRSARGGIIPTKPFSHHVQGTAMWWMMKAMIRCQEKLDEWRDRDGFDGFITLQVHDELVFDFPKSGRSIAVQAASKARLRGDNLWRARTVQRLMEQGGDDIGVPTPVSVSYHEHDYSEGIEV